LNGSTVILILFHFNSLVKCSELSSILYKGHNSTCFFVFGATASSGPRPPHSRGFSITHDAPQLAGLLWTSDQLVAENSTWQHTQHNKQTSMLQWDSNPQSQ